jgi:hypothetical protein
MSISRFRTSFLFKAFSIYIALSFTAELVAPTVAFALTSGPSQPEVQSFEPAGTTEMVDLFSGDFVYNIPLLELPGPNGGYPFNLSYHSGIGMDQEASWVGLGWNLNPGVINRGMRGMPDDFNGDLIKKTTDIKDNYTYGVSFGGSIKLFGADKNKPPKPPTPKSSGNPAVKATGLLSLSMRFYYNSYKGVGYSLSPTLGYGAPREKLSTGIGANVGLSLDSQEGVGANASISLKQPDEEGNPKGSFRMGVGFNSASGLRASYSGGTSRTRDQNGGKWRTSKESLGGGSSISFATPSFVPSISMPMISENLDIQVPVGVGVGGTFTDLSIGGFYSTQSLFFKGIPREFKAYGYNYLEEAGDRDVMDFNRSKDGVIRKESPNLAIPQLTYDVYSVSGQGIGGMYRPYRSDIGHVHDPKVESYSSGGAFGIDLGPKDHWGANFTYNNGSSVSGDWATENNWYSSYNFKGQDAGVKDDYEAVYFKAHGEMTSFDVNELDFIGQQGPVRAELNKDGTSYNPVSNKLVNRNATKASGATIKNIREKKQHDSYRMSRNMSVQPLTNEQLGSSTSVLGEYQITLDGGGGILDRSSRPDHHIGGITSINAEGVRYVYGLPAYNTKQEEYLFSVGDGPVDGCGPEISIPGNLESGGYKVDETEEYYNKTELPPYAYSYLLTSILGTDYVDVNLNGPDDADYGYWVKFTYEKVANDYVWKAPYLKANYIKGFESSAADNKAAFTQGAKEVYYLAQAETKTHKVVFTTSERSDAKEAVLNGNNAASSGGATDYFHRLDNMKLYVKESAKLLQTIDFGYSYDLCAGTDNSDASGGGKLTLENVKMTYQNNSRGSLSPYEFTYGDLNHDGTTDSDANEDYHPNQYDRWGNFKGYTDDQCQNVDFPYTAQFRPGVDEALFKDTVDTWAANWHLTDIKLPTGGKIQIDYETDDYAYVQHKKAMQMFKVADISGLDSETSADWAVSFNLEHPIASDHPSPAAAIKEAYLDHLGHDYQLYYNIKFDLRDGRKESIAGYANLNMTPGGYGIDATSLDGGYYHRGFVKLKAMDINGTVNYHPFRVAAWQHMKVDQPELLFSKGKLDGEPGTTKAAKAAKVKSLMGVFTRFKTMFVNYRKHAKKKGYANDFVANESFIRLCNPDGFKYGGGSRVKKIQISDEWSSMSTETSAAYGQVYAYTIEEDGELISSGVAQYEPAIGGDENPFRYAKNYANHTPVMTDNNLFFEYPINEAYYPGASVGYRKVTVSSLATDKVLKTTFDPTVVTTGQVEHEFYTAKEYPVITGETDIEKKPYNLTVMLPFLGQKSTNTLTVSQGYSIALNDMHGKQKSVKYYGMDKYGKRIPKEISKVEYYYKDKRKLVDGQLVKQLDNEVDVLLSDYDPNTGKAEMEKRLMGVEYEFFTDMRKSRNESAVRGISGNTDMLILPIPIPTPWPNIVNTTVDLRTVTTNKIIHKAAILEKTVATDGESTVTTHNKLFDALTGKALLTTVQNNYDDPIYKMEYAAHWNYEGMGAAYKNFGYVDNLLISKVDGDGVYKVIPPKPAEFHRIMQEGDELLVYNLTPFGEGTIPLDPQEKATLIEHLDLGDGNYSYRIHSNETYDLGDYLRFRVVRSGRRNQLSVSAGEVLALGDPTATVNEENLDTVNLSNAPEDFVDFMNNEVLQCDGELKVQTLFSLDSRENYDHEAKHKYPQTKKILKELKFDYCITHHDAASGLPPNNMSAHLCTTCLEFDHDYHDYSGNTPIGTALQQKNNHEGYHIGSIVTRTMPGPNPQCECVAYRRLRGTGDVDSPVLSPILNFQMNTSTTVGSYSIGRLKVNYSNRASSDFCVFPRGSALAVDTTIGVDPNWNTCWDQVKYVPKVIYFDSVLNASAVEFTDYWDNSYPIDPCSGGYTEEANLYASGKKGIFRVKKNYYYDDARVQTANMKLNADGMYENVDVPGKALRFYPFRWNADLDWPLHERWISNQQITKYNSGGFEVENVDVLGIASSARYGYGKTLPVAVASNASYYQLYAENADDPTAVPKLSGGTSATISTTYRHTGKQSIEVVNGGGDKVIRTSIRPEEGATYYVSGWVNVENKNEPKYGSFISGISVNFYDEEWTDTPENVIGIPLVGSVVEGWQRMEGEVTVPAGYGGGLMGLVLPDHASYDIYYDDFRVIPTQSNIKTYVYDPDTYRLSAVLDENNFASLYFYDEQGQLFLVKKETEKGIFTIQESRTHIQQP